MQATDPPTPSLLTAPGAREVLGERVAGIEEVRGEEAGRIAAILAEPAHTAEEIRDAVSTRLMEVFRLTRSRGAFGLLYELNSSHLLTQVGARLRRYSSKADPLDVLQEVFFNVYRYPHRFDATRTDAFRVWSAMIVRNTVLKHLRSHGAAGRSEVAFEDLSDQPVTRGTPNPLHGVLERESTRECARVYLTYLQLYLRFYSMLSDRERKALHIVEVENRSYRSAAEELGIKLENLKMVIFRARRKIHRAMRRVFDGLSPDCRPARDPRPRGGGAHGEEGARRTSNSPISRRTSGRGGA